MAVAFRPFNDTPVRFLTTLSLSQDMRTQGIDGIYKDGRFWSTDMADHWTIHEVTGWEHRATQAAPAAASTKESA